MLIKRVLARLEINATIAQYIGSQSKYRGQRGFVLGKGRDKKFVIQFFSGITLHGVDKNEIKVSRYKS